MWKRPSREGPERLRSRALPASSEAQGLDPKCQGLWVPGSWVSGSLLETGTGAAGQGLIRQNPHLGESHSEPPENLTLLLGCP